MTRLVEDHSLRAAFRRGERHALEAVYREYARSVFDLLAHRVAFLAGGRACRFHGYATTWELEDAVQMVFLRAFAEPARLAYDGLRPYRNYLFTIAVNLLVDLLRSGRKDLFSLDDAASAGAGSGGGEGEVIELGAAAPTPEEHSAEGELRAHVEAFVAALSADERAIFEVRFQEGLAVEECARRLAVSEHRVKATERRLKKLFFHAMRRHGYFEGYRFDAVTAERVAQLLILAGSMGSSLASGGKPWLV